MKRFVFAGCLAIVLLPAAAYADAIDDNTLCYDALNSGHDKNAVDYCTKAISSCQLVKEDLVAALINRGVAFRNLGNSKLAVADYTEALKNAPKDAMIYANRSNALRDIGDFERALEDGKKAVELDPHRGASFFVRGAAYDALNRLDSARKDYMQALTLEPSNRDYQDRILAIDTRLARQRNTPR